MIALILAAIVAVSGDAKAQPACPRQVEPGRAIVLASPDGRRSEVTLLDGGRVRVDEQNPGLPRTFPRTTMLVRGLIGLEVAGPGGKVVIAYDTQVEGIFPLSPGKQHTLAYTSEADGRPPLKGRMAVAVLEALQHRIGACAYDALLIERYSEFDNGQRTPIRYDVWVPALQAVVKSTLFDDVARTLIETETYEFETIAAK